MCLLIGSSGVGKTLLLKRLNACTNRGSYNDIGEPPATIATVGTNLMTVITSRKQEVTVRELGGVMAPIWHNYYDDCNALMFMVDLSNRAQISASCIQMLDVLSSSQLQKVPVLIILNKIDVPNCMKRIEFDSIIRLEDIIKHSPQTVKVVEVSARDGQGLHDVTKWIQEHGKPASPS